MLVPELMLRSPEEGGKVLERFGFRADGGLWRLGSQALKLVGGEAEGRHGRIDHLALTVPDIDAAVAALAASGIALDAQITPGGPELIQEFWGDGLRFAYLSGPEGARIELCQRVTGAPGEVGHDHVGIPCNDIAAMQDFFTAQGAHLTAAVDLSRPEGTIPVRFLSFQGGVIELFQPASARRAARGLWSRLLVSGLHAPVQGPEDLILGPL